jgi:hypothetical protein
MNITKPNIEEYYLGLYNYGCDPVFTWCPSGIPTTLKFYSFLNTDNHAGLFSGQLGLYLEAYVIRRVVGLKRFICETK